MEFVVFKLLSLKSFGMPVWRAPPATGSFEGARYIQCGA